MWRKTGQFILAYRFPLLLILIAATALMGYWASKVELSYEFSRAIPVNHPANKTYQAFKQKYGQDGNLLRSHRGEDTEQGIADPERDIGHD